MTNTELILEVIGVFSHCFLGVKSAVTPGDIAISAGTIVVVVDAFPRDGGENVIARTCLALTNVHLIAYADSFRRFIIFGIEPTVVEGNVVVATCAISLVVKPKEVSSLVDRIR